MSDPRCPGYSPGYSQCYCGAQLRVVYLPKYNDEFPAGVQVSDNDENCCEFTPEQAMSMTLAHEIEDLYGNVCVFTTEQLVDMRRQLASVVAQLQEEGGEPDHVVVAKEASAGA